MSEFGEGCDSGASMDSCDTSSMDTGGETTEATMDDIETDASESGGFEDMECESDDDSEDFQDEEAERIDNKVMTDEDEVGFEEGEENQETSDVEALEEEDISDSDEDQVGFNDEDLDENLDEDLEDGEDLEEDLDEDLEDEEDLEEDLDEDLEEDLDEDPEDGEDLEEDLDENLEDEEDLEKEDESEDDPEGEEKAENEETVKQAENASEDADSENKEENTDAAEMENKAQNPEDEDAYHTAMNNMAQYLSEHNYGREDYAIYSKDPEWQKLNADLQRSLGMEVTTAPESGNEVSNIDLPDNCVMVDASDIDMSTAMGMDNEHFWNHHGNTKEDYMQLAEKIPDVQQALESGKTLDEIKQDPELRNTANAYFDPENMVKVEQQEDGSYTFIDDGRHRVAAAQEMGYQIPVEVANMSRGEDLPETDNGESNPENKEPEDAAEMDNIANKSDISNETSENLESFEQNKWDNLTMQEKEKAIENLRDSVASDLQLENKPNIAYYDKDDPSDFGGYAASTNTIYINRFNMGDAKETADTVAHESRHCWQHERADNPQTEQDYKFKENFEDYIRPEDDYRAYKNQIVEKDARDYATRVTDMIPSESSISDSRNVNENESEIELGNEDYHAPPEDVSVDSKTIDRSELPADFESKDKVGDYTTKIDGKVEDVEKEPLPDSIVQSFKDGEYRTVVTTEPVTLYRVYGGGATAEGSYCTTEPCIDKDKTRNDLALKTSWGNTIEKEAEIVVPSGTKLNIGRVEQQSDNGKTLTGNADQILLPQNWNQDWVKKVRDID